MRLSRTFRWWSYRCSTSAAKGSLSAPPTTPSNRYSATRCWRPCAASAGRDLAATAGAVSWHDDDPLELELIQAVLGPEGYTVLKATSGEDGMLAAERERPVLVILDLLPPEMDYTSVR